jgi:hypothetical protein
MSGLLHRLLSTRRRALGLAPPITGIQVTGGGTVTDTFGLRVITCCVLVIPPGGSRATGFRAHAVGIGLKDTGLNGFTVDRLRLAVAMTQLAKQSGNLGVRRKLIRAGL